jgi:response regulator NasT
VKVLVAEDETIIRLDLCALLAKHGFSVCAEARDGAEAVTLARTTQPEAAILDLRMPNLDGIEAARRIYAERPIPIVMLTAFSDRSYVDKAIAAGVFAYLVKPFRESDVVPRAPSCGCPTRRAPCGAPDARGRAAEGDPDRSPLGERARMAAARRAKRGWFGRSEAGAMRVLIGEDESLIRLDLRVLLERAGFEVCAEAHDGEEAVELARSAQPDLALLDVKMPRLDGIEAARRMLDERPIPIVIVSAYTEQSLVERAADAGVFGYLAKPFREEDLLPAIATARARFSQLAAVREQVDTLADALADRKAIERAKGILMANQSLTEAAAFARLRKASQVSGRPMRVIAEAIIETFA